MIDEHLESLRREGYSLTTLSVAGTWLRKLSSFCDGRELTQLGPQDLQNWHKSLAWIPGVSGKLYSQNTVNQAVGAARRFYRWALCTGLVEQDPTTGLVTPHAKDAVSPKLRLAPAQVRKFLFSPDLDTPTGIRNRAVLGILLETEISRPACSRLDLHHLQLDTGALLSQGRVRQVHSLSDGLLCDLKRYLDEARPLLVVTPSPALFLNNRGGRLSPGSVQQILRFHIHRCNL